MLCLFVLLPGPRGRCFLGKILKPGLSFRGEKGECDTCEELKKAKRILGSPCPDLFPLAALVVAQPHIVEGRCVHPLQCVASL
jgi:hypothetical protein